MPNIFSKSEVYLSPNYTSSATITLTLTSTSLGGLSVTEAHISSSPNFTSYDTVTITTSPQNANFTLANPATDGLKYVYVRYKNSGGAFSETYSHTVYLDTANPTKPGQPHSSSSWSKVNSAGNPAIVWNWTSAFDANGISSYHIEIEENTGSGFSVKKIDGTTNTSYSYEDLIDGATYRARVKAIDLVGKESGFSDYSPNVTADIIAPHDASITILNQSSASITETSSRSVKLKVEADEDIGESGLNKVRFRNKPIKLSYNGSEKEYQVSNWSSWFTFSTSPTIYDWNLPKEIYGDVDVEAQIQDVAENSAYVQDRVEILSGFIIDTVSPNGSMEINDGNPSTNNTTVKVDISGEDATTGILAMRFRDSDRTWSDWEPFDSLRYYEMESTEGLKVIESQLKDYGGNIVSSSNQVFNKTFLNPENDVETNYLTNEYISYITIFNNALYAFSVGSSADLIYASIYKFLNNQFIRLYEFKTEEEFTITAVESFGDNIYIATTKSSQAKIYSYNPNNNTVALSTNLNNLESKINIMEVYKNKLYAGSNAGYIYIFDGVNWSSRGDTETIDTGEIKVGGLQVYNNYLHIATGNSGNMYTYNGSTLSTATSTGAQSITDLTILNDMLLGVSQSTREIYAYREYLNTTIWGETQLFNREPSDPKNTVIWNKYEDGSPTVTINQSIMEIDAPEDSTILYIQNKIGQTWVDGVSNATGWTLQLAVQGASDGYQGIRFSDGTYGGELKFNQSKIQLNYGTQSTSYTTDMASAIREIRIVGKGTSLKVFLDREEIISVIWNSVDSSKDLQFGDLAIFEASKAKWDILRISTQGAYEPTDIAELSNINVISWYANDLISDISSLQTIANGTKIEDEITTVLINDVSISEISNSIDDVRNAITDLNNYIGSSGYENILNTAESNGQITTEQKTSFENDFDESKNNLANISSQLLETQSKISTLNEINIQSLLVEIDSIVTNLNYYVIRIEDIITEDIPNLPIEEEDESEEDPVQDLLDEMDGINLIFDGYIVSLDEINYDLVQSGDILYVAGKTSGNDAKIWSTYDLSSYSEVIALASGIDTIMDMTLYPTDNVGSEVKNRLFTAGMDSVNNYGYIKLLRPAYIADSILLDTTAPSGTVVISPDGSGDGAETTNSNIVTIKITGSDELSGIDAYELAANNEFTGSSYVNWISSPTYVNNYDLTSTETAFVELKDFNENVTALEVFESQLYIGTASGKIYRTFDFEEFTEVFSGSSKINSLVEYDTKIYAGTESGVLLESSNGALNNWTTKSTGLVNAAGGIDVVPIYTMKTIGSSLYIGGGNSLLNYFDLNSLNYVYNFSEDAVLSITYYVKSNKNYILVGTSDTGKIFGLDPDTSNWSIVYNTDETEISSMSAINLDNIDNAAQYVLAGSSSNGKLYLYNISTDEWSLFHDTAETKIWSMENMLLSSDSTTSYPSVVMGTGNNGRLFVFRKMNGEPRILALSDTLNMDIIYSLKKYGDNMYVGTGESSDGALFKYDGSLVGNGVRSVYLRLKDRAGNVNSVDIFDSIDLEILYENMLMEINSGGSALFSYTAGNKLYSGYKIENEYGVFESIDFDAGADFNQWNSLSWIETKPTNTNVQVYVKTAESKADLANTDYNGPYTNKNGNDISELDGQWIKYKIVLSSSEKDVEPIMDKLSITYYAAESVHFFTTLFSGLSGNVENAVMTWTPNQQAAFCDVKVGISTSDSIDFNDYQIVENNKSFSIDNPDNQFKIGIKLISSGENIPEIDEFAILWENDSNSIDLVND